MLVFETDGGERFDSIVATLLAAAFLAVGLGIAPAAAAQDIIIIEDPNPGYGTPAQTGPGSVTVTVRPHTAPAAPPAYGYGYAPSPQLMDPRMAELAQLQADYSRYRIGGPIALMSMGLGVGAILGLSAMAVSFDCGYWETCDTATGLGVASAIFFAAGVGSLVWMIRRVRRRRPIGQRIRQLRLELRADGLRADIGLPSSPSGGFMSTPDFALIRF